MGSLAVYVVSEKGLSAKSTPLSISIGIERCLRRRRWLFGDQWKGISEYVYEKHPARINSSCSDDNGAGNASVGQRRNRTAV